MDIVISFFVGVIASSIGWYFVVRNNRKRLEQLLDKVEGK